MHELSIAENILGIIHEHVPADQLSATRLVKLRIGALAGVVPESLQFSFRAITAGTLLEDASLEFDQIPFMIDCDNCGASVECAPGVRVCPCCGSKNTQITGGTELDVMEISLSDQRPEVQ